MREIEIKARVRGFEGIIASLTKQGVEVSLPVTQHDIVYGPAGVDGDDDNTAPWLRIRTETKDGKVTHFFTLKRSVTNQLDSIEHETMVADEKELQHIIEQLGFELYSDLTKTRRKAHLQDDTEMCLDEVDGLGYFVEAERLTADEVDYSEVVESLWELLESAGVSRSDEVTDGYDVLINKQLARE